jgi:hypothetical protein
MKFDFEQRLNWYKSNANVCLDKPIQFKRGSKMSPSKPISHVTKRNETKPLRRSHQLPPISAMAGEGSGAGAEMDALIRRLRLHQAGPSPYDPAPAASPAAGGGGELFRPRRAAVLVCLFRGAAGELRVILTKRSSTLSTHSGERLARFLACPSSVLCLRVWVRLGAVDPSLPMPDVLSAGIVSMVDELARFLFLSFR